MAQGLGMAWLDRPAPNRGAVPGSPGTKPEPRAPGLGARTRAPSPGLGPPRPGTPVPGVRTPGPGARGRALGLGHEQRSLSPGPRDAGSKAVPRRLSGAWHYVPRRPQ